MTPRERLEHYHRESFPLLRVAHVGEQMREAAHWLAPTLAQSFYATGPTSVPSLTTSAPASTRDCRLISCIR